MKTIIHIDQQILRQNRLTGSSRPPVTVKTYRSNDRCQSVWLEGPAFVHYNRKKPLACGATVWIETYSRVELIGKAS